MIQKNMEVKSVRNTSGDGPVFNRFWFTDFDSVSANEPTGILERIFFSPKDFEEGALYGFRD